jgi:hypothetical protein
MWIARWRTCIFPFEFLESFLRKQALHLLTFAAGRESRPSWGLTSHAEKGARLAAD